VKIWLEFVSRGDAKVAIAPLRLANAIEFKGPRIVHFYEIYLIYLFLNLIRNQLWRGDAPNGPEL
jgi:hypothetical protein